MLDSLTRRVAGIFQGVRRKGRLTESDVTDVLKEIRVALLEADVNFRVAKDFIAKVKEKAVGEDLFGSLNADQTIIKLVRDELVEILGTETTPFNYGSRPPTVILMAGLQGSGKTTTTAKLASWLIKEGKKPMLAACDLQRPAAIKQLEVLGEQVGVPVFTNTDPGAKAPQVARAALERCQYLMNDVLIVDTAGRLQVDEDLMAELAEVAGAVSPTETFLVLDSTTGQEAVNVANVFHERIPLTGAIFTKLDGDTRGGAILSVRAATGVPVRFIGVGEQVAALEQFHPTRMAERIIGMGDVMGIIEQAEEAFRGEDMSFIERAMGKGDMNFNTMLEVMRMTKKLGPMKKIIAMLPGAANLPEGALDEIEKADTRQVEAIILSMTPKERTNPDIINGSRRKRIAAGSGTSVEEVNRVLKQFYEGRRNMKQLTQMQQRMAKSGGLRRR